MLKTHNKTGLKYLCKTSTIDPNKPFNYNGSGKYWKKHLKKHGYDITTEILKICSSRAELVREGIYYSKLYNIVQSKEFANIVEERGDGGPTMLGRVMTDKQNIKKSRSLRAFHKSTTDDYKAWRRELNSRSHEKFRYHTPAGTFTNAFKAAAANNCSNVTIINRCVNDCDKPILSKKYWKYGWKGKTWRELGWWSDL